MRRAHRGRTQLEFKFHLWRLGMMPAVAPVSDMLPDIVPKVAALTEGSEVGAVVVLAVAVQMRDGKNDAG